MAASPSKLGETARKQTQKLVRDFQTANGSPCGSPKRLIRAYGGGAHFDNKEEHKAVGFFRGLWPMSQAKGSRAKELPLELTDRVQAFAYGAFLQNLVHLCAKSSVSMTRR